MTDSKKKSLLKKAAIFVMGAAFGLSLAGGVAFADSINVSLNPLKLLVNGVDKTPSDNQFSNNGAVVPAELIYNGTTYLPVRMVSNLLGTPISYDGANKTIHIGNDPMNTVYLSDMQPYAINGSFTGTLSNNDPNTIDGNYFDSNKFKQMTMAGTNYAKGVSIAEGEAPHQVYYNLNGKYSSLSGLIGLDDISDSTDTTVTIYGDGNKLWSGEFKNGDLPQSFNIPVTGVNQLEIELTQEDFPATIVDIANPVLK